MIVGFNHNVSYRGVGFHVQTEDSGVKSPQLITLLYHGGTIIASQKTVYADILKVDNLGQVVEDLAKEQHKGMLRRLTKGEFDTRVVELGIPLGPVGIQSGSIQEIQTEEAAEIEPIEAVDLPEATAHNETELVAEPVKIVEEPIVDKFRKSQKKPPLSLDDLILAYLTGEERD